MIVKKLHNKIINGDSLEELKKIPDETFDLIFADPPYNLQVPVDKSWQITFESCETKSMLVHLSSK